MNRFSTQYQPTNPFQVRSYVYRYGFNGKERDESIATSNLDFGARMFNSDLARWFCIDDKYFRHFELNPYGFASSNPIYFLDFDGNDFIASKKTRSSVESHIRLAFGTTEGISWDKSGKMIVDREKLYTAALASSETGSLSQDQEYLFKSFIDGQVLNSDLIIRYDESHATTATTGEIETSSYKQAISDKARVFINVNNQQKDFEEKINDTATGRVVKGDGTELTTEEKKATAFWHEVGHIHIWKKVSTKKDAHYTQTVGFENFFRRIIGATARKGDKHGEKLKDGKYDKGKAGCDEPYDAPANSKNVEK